MNRIKNLTIFIILVGFLCFVALMPVTCVFKTVTGISCPACGMTRAFTYLFHFQLLDAIYQNILSIPLAIFLCYFIVHLVIDFVKNQFVYVPNLLQFLEKHYVSILILVFCSLIFNNLKF